MTRHLSARKTVVGWCVAGVEIFVSSQSRASTCLNIWSDEADMDLSRLWIDKDLTVAEKIASSAVLEEVQKSINFRKN